MNIRQRRIRVLAAAGAILLAAAGLYFAAAWAADSSPAEAPDYQDYNLKRPWFSKQKWDWFLDMVNQPSIKPQETGTFQNLPEHSVPRTGVEPFIAPDSQTGGKLTRDVLPKNPLPASAQSVAHGKAMYDIYCAACHAANGSGMTPVTQKGMPPMPLVGLVANLSESHIYNKALYGGPLMPTYGFQTSAKERWDIVNYVKSAQFGK